MDRPCNLRCNLRSRASADAPRSFARSYDRTSRLHEIKSPALFLCGRYDEASPEATATYHREIPGSEMVIFEKSSHTPFLEEPELYLEVLRDFLRRVETSRP